MAIARTKTTSKAKPVIEEVEVVEVEEEVVEEMTVAKAKKTLQNQVEKFAYKVKEQCDNAPKKSIFIPTDDRNPDIDSLEINLSGYRYFIPRGVECEVPKPIYDIWKESYEKTLAAERKIVRAKDPVANL